MTTEPSGSRQEAFAAWSAQVTEKMMAWLRAAPRTRAEAFTRYGIEFEDAVYDGRIEVGGREVFINDAGQRDIREWVTAKS